MPHGELHKRKIKKNLAVLLLIVLFALAVWAVTIIKMTRPAEAAEFDPYAEPFVAERQAHAEKIAAARKRWFREYTEYTPEREERRNDWDEARADHMKAGQEYPQIWWDEYFLKAK